MRCPGDIKVIGYQRSVNARLITGLTVAILGVPVLDTVWWKSFEYRGLILGLTFQGVVTKILSIPVHPAFQSWLSLQPYMHDYLESLWSGRIKMHDIQDYPNALEINYAFSGLWWVDGAYFESKTWT